jgi:hypothetical protein
MTSYAFTNFLRTKILTTGPRGGSRRGRIPGGGEIVGEESEELSPLVLGKLADEVGQGGHTR